MIYVCELCKKTETDIYYTDSHALCGLCFLDTINVTRRKPVSKFKKIKNKIKNIFRKKQEAKVI